MALKRLLLPVSILLVAAGLFIGARDLFRAASSLLWTTELAITTQTGQLVQLHLMKLVENYPVDFGRFNWLVGGAVAALGAFGLVKRR